MPPPPVHRRLTFWLGLIVLISLKWAWFASYRHESGISSGDVTKYTSISSTSGGISIHRVQDLTGSGLPAGPGKRGIYAFHRPRDRTNPWQQPSGHLFHSEESTDELSLYRYRDITIGYPLIVLTYLLLWLALSILLHRRQRKLLESRP